MSNEDLLNPRYKIIADYPSNLLPVNAVIKCPPYDREFSKNHWCEMHDKFPHIYKKLKWFEERSLNTLPKYVKDAFVPETSEYHKVFEISLYEPETNTVIANGCKFSLIPFLSSKLPATKEEYLKNLKLSTDNTK